MAEYLPVKGAGQLRESDETDIALVQGIKANTGNLTFEDGANGVKTLTELAAGGGISPELQNAISQGYNTGSLEGLTVTINGGDPTQFDVAAGTVNVLDTYTSTGSPVFTPVNFPGAVGVSRTTGGESPQATQTLLGINAAGSIVQFADTVPGEELRDASLFGKLWHPAGDGNAILSAGPTGITGQGAIHSFHVFRSIFGLLRQSGLIYSANGANQSLDRSGGIVNGLGINGFDTVAGRKSTGEATLSPVVMGSIHRAYRDATNGLVTDGPTPTWDPSVWDDGSGVLQAFPGADNYGIARGYVGPEGVVVLGVPQETFRTLEDALSNITTPVEERAYLLDSVPTTWCVFRKDATVFTNSDEAQFFSIPPLFRLGGGGVTSATGSAVVVRYATTSSVTPHSIRDPAAGVVRLDSPGEANQITATFPALTEGSSGPFTFRVKVGPVGGSLTTVGDVSIAQGTAEGTFTPASPVAFNAGDAMHVEELAIGAFVGSNTINERCTLTMRYVET